MTTNVIPAKSRGRRPRIDVQRLKDRVPVSDLALRLTKLKRTGHTARGLCPFHDERSPSFLVDDARGVWHCFGCGRGGDQITLMIEAGATDFVDACRRIAALAGGDHAKTIMCTTTPTNLPTRVELARSEWRMAGPLGRTMGTTYLRARGLDGIVPGSVRYSQVPAHWDPETGTPGRRRPALIAAVQDAAGSITGIQRIFVDPHRPGWPFKPLRLSLGRIKGSALRLGPVRDTIMLAASVEDGLALRQMFVGASVWCAIGDDNLTNVIFPPPVKTVVIAGDGDEQGRAAVERARVTHESRSLIVHDLCPKTKDFNSDWLLLSNWSAPTG